MELKVLQQDLGRHHSEERQAGGDVAPCCLQLLHRLQFSAALRNNVCKKLSSVPVISGDPSTKISRNGYYETSGCSGQKVGRCRDSSDAI